MSARAHRLLRALGLAALLVPTVVLADVKTEDVRHVDIRGAGAMVRMARLVAERFMADHADAVVTVSGGGTARGIKSVILGTAEIGLATEVMPEDVEKLARDRKVKLARHDVYRDALFAVVHPKNPVSDLSLAQLRDIFRGVITNWKDVGGNDAPIVLVTHEPTTSAYETFKGQVLGDEAVISPTATVVTMRTFEKTMTEDAIGYIGLRGARALKPLTIDKVQGNAETVRNGSYAIRRTLVLYTLDPPRPAVTEVVGYFLAPDKGQAIVKAQGDVPLK